MKISVKNMQRKTEAKNQIRSEYRNKRNSLEADRVKLLSGEICKRLIETELFKQAEDIYFYYPLGNEVNLLEAAREALKQGKRIGFPKTEGNDVLFYQVENLEDFTPGSFHVMEPVSDKLLTAKKPLILTPGLVFDKQKNRMGYGKGYYDRYAASVPKAVKIGIAYEIQIAHNIPVDCYDVPMDYVLTELRIW